MARKRKAGHGSPAAGSSKLPRTTSTGRVPKSSSLDYSNVESGISSTKSPSRSSSPHNINPLQSHLLRLLSNRAFPKTICPSEACRALSKGELQKLVATGWRDLMPACRDIVWELRDSGAVEILQKGQVLGNDVKIEDVSGPIRIRKSAQFERCVEWLKV